MAIHFWKRFSESLGTRNFGDDLNPLLLEKLFSKRLIESREACILGIGTILNDENLAAMQSYEKKIVFSSGTGYGDFAGQLDASWQVACVRGPKTAGVMNIDPSKAVCDGAVLLSDFHDVVPEAKRDAVVFIPHVHTDRAIGRGLRDICGRLGLRYVTPAVPHEDFIREVSAARLVVTEAMHGAILADTMRTPWICCHIMNHNRFKWEDWCASVGVPYAPAFLGVRFSDEGLSSPRQLPRYLVSGLRRRRIEARLRAVVRAGAPVLSDGEVLEARKSRLRAIIREINLEHGN
jgi:succinoglycan biosynthesis protein ExoV